MPDEKIYSVVVTGRNGQLGKELALIAPQFPRFRFYFLSREDFSIDDTEKMRRRLEENPADYLINCAAFTAVDKAEAEPDQAGASARWCLDFTAKAGTRVAGVALAST